MVKPKRVSRPPLYRVLASRMRRRREPACVLVLDGVPYGECEKCACVDVLIALPDGDVCERCAVEDIDGQLEALHRRARDLVLYYASVATGAEPR